MTESNNYSEYNFSSGSVKTVSEIYEIICEKVKGEYIEPVYKISSDKEIKSQYLDTTQIESDLNVKSIFPIDDSIRLTVDWYKNYFSDK